MSSPETNSADKVVVIFVRKKDAKTVKNALEEGGWIDKDYRIAGAIEESFHSTESAADVSFKDCLAIAVLPDFMDLKEKEFSNGKLVIGRGHQPCPFSSSVLGNRQKRQILLSNDSNHRSQWSPLKEALLLAIKLHFKIEDASQQYTNCQAEIAELAAAICPAKLEYLGDDQNLVLTPTTFLAIDLQMFLQEKLQLECPNVNTFMEILWNQVAFAYDCPRILRKGGVDPNSRIRQTGYQLQWSSNRDANNNNWITVTEQGIRQSFDVTQVMFSRGNISEKIRFGTQLVQKGDVVLDLYAGIGYYTLPALLKGQASYVYACEWNPHALKALEYNVRDNHADGQVSIVAGDCRKLVLPFVNKEVAPVNRVSLGLLPSSEGGWKIAVQVVLGTLPREGEEGASSTACQTKGGWLHVHGNVPVQERDVWAQWMVCRFYQLVLDEISDNRSLYKEDWIVVCQHVEKVKSFAPTVNHYVADVFVGPKSQLGHHPQQPPEQADALLEVTKEETCLCYNPIFQQFEACPENTPAPSCALSAEGVLHQEWMMPNNSAGEQEDD